jgi:hypothetical protein
MRRLAEILAAAAFLVDLLSGPNELVNERRNTDRGANPRRARVTPGVRDAIRCFDAR